MNKNKPIILVGGGTGGHIYPLVALGEEFQKKGIKFIYVGGIGREKEIIGNLKWPYSQISVGKWRRYWTLKDTFLNFVDFFRFINGFFQAIKILISTGSPLVISKGGFVSLPMTMAAKLLGRKLFVHESDTIFGMSNRFSARFADVVMTAFPPKIYQNANNKYLQTGIPLRYPLRQAATLMAPKKDKDVLLVIGGIQGSRSINSLIGSNLEKLLKKFDIIHITGEKDFEKFKKIADDMESTKNIYKPFAFVERELPYYFQIADLVISRASATTIAEGALFGKAMYLIPLPNSASNHQVKNASVLNSENAAFTKEEYQITPDSFYQDIMDLTNNNEKISSLGKNLKKYFHEENSIDIIIQKIEEKLNGKK